MSVLDLSKWFSGVLFLHKSENYHHDKTLRLDFNLPISQKTIILPDCLCKPQQAPTGPLQTHTDPILSEPSTGRSKRGRIFPAPFYHLHTALLASPQCLYTHIIYIQYGIGSAVLTTFTNYNVPSVLGFSVGTISSFAF